VGKSSILIVRTAIQDDIQRCDRAGRDDTGVLAAGTGRPRLRTGGALCSSMPFVILYK